MDYYIGFFLSFLALNATYYSPLISNERNINKRLISRVGIERYIPTVAHQPTITIWIHGTKFIQNKIFKNQFKNTPSLQPVTNLPKDYHLYLIAEQLCTTAPDQFSIDHFYIFGWSGKLSMYERKKSALILLTTLTHVIQKYRHTYNIDPIVQIITHSHGGNIALSMAHWCDKQCPSLYIDRLIMLAVPVQAHTAPYTQHPMFRKIYALYSSLDFIQIMAPELTKTYRLLQHEHRFIKFPPLSARTFSPLEHLYQIKLKLNGRALFHSDFVRTKYAQLLPAILQQIDAWHTQQPEICLRADPKLLCIYTKPTNSLPFMN